MANIRSKLFLGCNYNDQSIKSSFNNIRDRIEKDTPLQCIVIDKRTNKAAKDLWVDIQKEIAEAALCVFDISGFRPNVILELGLALAIKNNDQILITFRTRRTKGKQPQWLLSDIGHLQRFQYGAIPDLERHIREQIEHLDYMKSFKDFLTRCKSDTTAPDKYALNGLKILRTIRDEGEKNDDQIQDLLQGSSCRQKTMIQLLRSVRLINRHQSPYGRYYIG